MKKKLILVGSGGFGQEVYSYLLADLKNNKLSDIELIGILDDSEDSYAKSGIELPLLGSISEYEFESNNRFIVCIGNVRVRKYVTEQLLENGAKPYTYIHSSCFIAENAKIGRGVIICPNSIINVNACIGNNVVINVFCSIGHGANIGEGSILSPYSALNGDASIGKYCFLGTRATVFPRVSLFDNCILDTHSAAKKSVTSPSVIADRAKYICVPNRFC